MQKRSLGIFGILAVLSFIFVPVTFAHEFIVKPATMAPHAGQVLPLSVVSAHVFMVSEEMEPAEQVNLSLYSFCRKTAILRKAGQTHFA